MKPTRLFGLVALALCWCLGESSLRAQGIVMNQPSVITATSATFTGSINPLGGIFEVIFLYQKPGTGVFFETPLTTFSGTGSQAVSATALNLAPNTAYTVVMQIVNGATAAESYSQTFNFQTLSPDLAITNVASGSLAANSAVLTANLNVNVLPSGAYFRYGKTTAYGSVSPTIAINATGGQTVSAGITNLSPNTLFHFSLVATNSAGTNKSGDFTFVTPAIIVTNVAVASVAANSAQATGSVNPNGTTVSTYFQSGTTTTYGQTSAAGSVSGATLQPLSGAITGLLPNTLYHYRLVASNSVTVIVSADYTLTTPAIVVANAAAAPVAANSAQLNASVNPNGAAVAAYFQYGTTTGYGGTTPVGSVSGTTNQPFTSAITNLLPNTLYHYRLVASNSLSVIFSGDLTLTTPAIIAAGPAVGFLAANGAQLTGVVNPNGTTVAAYFQYGPTTSYGSVSASNVVGGAGNQIVGAGITNLPPNTRYHFRLVASNSLSVSFSADATLTTLPVIPTNVVVSSVRPNSVQLNGSVNPNGAAIYSYFQYGATTGYGLFTPTNTGIQGFFPVATLAAITNLAPAETFHFRMVVGNSLFTSNSADVVFSTLSTPPAVSTAGATINSPTTAYLNGLVNPNGLATTAWFQWGTTLNYGNQTTPASMGKIQQSESTRSLLTGLLSGHVYHFRIAAANSAGTNYGIDQSFIMAARGVVLNGPNPLTVECHGTLADPGAYAAISQRAIAAGYVHSLVLRGDNTVVAWGASEAKFPFLSVDFGQADVPANLNSVVSIGAGTAHSIAVLTTGAVVGWGDNSLGQTGIPDGLTNAVAVASGDYHNVALKSDGTVAAWGWNEFYQTNVPLNLTSVVAVAAGGSHSLALQANGLVFGWGGNSTGEATPPSNLRNVVAIAAGDQFSLALKLDGTVAGWGDDAFGETSIPPGLSNVVAIAAAGDYALALLTNGTVVAWGDDLYGQTDVPVGLTNVVQIAAGYGHALAQLANGSVVAWGWDDFGQTDVPAGLNSVNATVTTSGTVDTTTPGTYTLTYSSTGLASATRAVVVTDTTPPVVTLQGANPFSLSVNSAFVDPGATAADVCAGNLTNIVRTGTLNTNVIGTYTLTYTATDPSGNYASVSRTVNVGAGAPIAVTVAAASVAATSATLNARVNPDGASSVAYFQWGITTNRGNRTVSVNAGAGVGVTNLAVNISGLSPATLYHFVAVATNSFGTNVGTDFTFTTPATLPGASFSYSWSATTATVNLAISPNGLATTYLIKWGASPSYGSTSSAISVGGGTAVTNVSYKITGLVPGTLYYFENVTQNADGSSSGAASFTTQSDAPAVTTLAAAPIAATTATLNGQVNPDAAAATAHFQWGLTTAYGNTTASTSVGNGNSAVAAAGSITGLTPLTTYHYRVVGVNSIGSNVGADLTFTTATAAPAATTVAASGTSSGSAVLNGRINPNNSPSGYYFNWGTTTAYGNTTVTNALGTGSAALAAGSTLTGLSPDTTYHYQVVATNATGTTFGGDLTFTTTAANAMVATLDASAVTAVAATLNGQVNPDGSATMAWFEWGTTTAYGAITATNNLGSGNVAVAVNSGITGLSPGTLYHFRLDAKNGLGMTAGADFTFTTGGAAPIVTTTVASAVTANSADLNGQVNPDGAATAYYFNWGANATYGNTTASTSLGGGTAVLPASFGLSGLLPGATYHFQVVATNSAGTSSGGDQSFTTPALLPTVTTVAASPITATNATLNGQVTPNGADTLAYFQWGTDTNYANTTTNQDVGAGDSVVAITGALTNLLPNTIYYYQLVATNNAGTNAGGGLSFTTPIALPAALTLTATAVTMNSAILNATINPGGDVTTADFNWDTTTNYANTTAVTNLPAGNTNDTISIPVTGLAYGTTYHFQVSANNSAGAVVGADVTFTTPGITPAVISQPPALVTGPQATLNAYVVPNGGDSTAWFEWGTTTAYGSQTAATNVPAGLAMVPITASLTALTPGTLYHYRVVVTNSSGIVRGLDQYLQPPQIALAGSNVMTVPYGSTFVDPGAVVTEIPMAISESDVHGLALKADGTVVSWGADYDGETVVPPGLINVRAIYAGTRDSLALTGDGTVYYWGESVAGIPSVAQGGNTVMLSGNLSGGLVLTLSGSVVAWGDDTYGETNLPAAALRNMVGVAGGYYFGLGLTARGEVLAWGDDTYGQTEVPGNITNIMAVFAGDNESLALGADGTVREWGVVGSLNAPIPAFEAPVVALSAGNSHSLALLADGSVVGWGDNTSGEISIPSGATNIVAISAGYFGSLALRADGTLLGWGSDLYGNLDIPAGLNVLSTPVNVSGSVDTSTPGTYELAYTATNSIGVIDTVTRTVIVAGAAPLAVTEPATGVSGGGATLNGLVTPQADTTVTFEWGTSVGYGNLVTLPSTVNGPNPVPISTTISGLQPGIIYHYSLIASNFAGVTQGNDEILWIPSVTLNGPATITNAFDSVYTDPGVTVTAAPTAIAAGNFHNLALKADGSVVGWGDNSQGETTIPPAAGGGVTAISAGFYHSLALTAAGAVMGWGWDQSGQVNMPAEAETNAIAISAGAYFSLALESDGSVIGWGDNSAGQATIPAGVNGNTIAISAGFSHSLALEKNGSVVGWGDDQLGEIDIPTNALSGVVAIGAGEGYSLALKSDGTVLAWGSGVFGQTNVPSGATNIVAISAGSIHCLALRSDGTVIGWGDDSNGEINIPVLTNVVAVAAGGDAYSLALQANGAIVGWGLDFNGDTDIPSGLNTLDLAPAVDGTVDTTTPGTYTLIYSVSNALGGVGTVERTVVVLPPQAPTVITLAATSGGATSATLNGTINPNSQPTTVTFLWGTDSTYGNSIVLPDLLEGAVNQSVSTVVSGLAPGIIYHYTISAASVGGTTNGADGVFGSLNIVLNGSASVTNAFNSTFTDPGAEVISVPLAAAASEGFDYLLQADGSVIGWGTDVDGSLDIPAAASSNVVAVAAGIFDGYALKQDGTILAWGPNDSGQNSIAETLGNVKALAAGYSFVVAAQNDGTVLSWGFENSGQTFVPADATNATAVAAGWFHALALRGDGSVVAWGLDTSGQSDVPTAASSGVVAITAGFSHSVALKNDGTVVVWGDDSQGQLDVPAGATNITAISAGQSFTMALRADGTVLAWGQNDENQTNIPPGATNVVHVGAGIDYCIAIRADGSVIAWGDDMRHQVDVPSTVGPVNAAVSGTVDTSTPGTYTLTYSATNGLGIIGTVTRTVTVLPPPAPVITVEPAETINGVAMLNAVVNPGGVPATVTFVWGTNSSYENSIPLPDRLEGATDQSVSTVVSGLTPGVIYHYTVMAINSGGVAYGDDMIFGSPAIILNGGAVVTNAYDTTFNDPGAYATSVPLAISAAEENILLLQADGSVVGWGRDDEGQVDVPVAAQSGVTKIAAGFFDGYALKNNGAIVSWGDDVFGEASAIQSQSDVKALAAGYLYVVAAKNDGSVVGFGIDNEGQIDIPAGATNVTAVAAGWYHVLALRGDGSVVAWGYDSAGQIDVPTTVNSGIVAVAAGYQHSLALKNDGTLVAWGDDTYGQIDIPANATNVTAISSGQNFNLALRADGSIIAWGYDAVGQIDVPSYATNIVVIAAGVDFGVAIRADGSVFAWGSGSSGQFNIPSSVGPVNATVSGTVDTSIPGAYELTYTVTNSFGGAATVTRTIIVSSPLAPLAITQAPSDIGGGSATLNGLVDPQGQNATVSFVWGTSVNYGNSVAVSGPVAGSGAQPVSATISGLQPGVVYHYAVLATNVGGAALGSDAVIWSPVVVLNGSSTVTLSQYAAFNDSGAFATASPLAVSTAETHSLALKADGTVVAWGANDRGQINVPASASNVVAIAAGDFGNHALRADASVIGWGDNTYGQNNIPAGVSGGNATAIADNADGGLALTDSGAVVAWGDNTYGETNVPPAAAQNIVAIASGFYHNLALTAGGQVIGWGYDQDGETIAPDAATNVVSIAAGQYHSLALGSDGTVYAWGNNNYGQLNVPAFALPVAALAGGDFHSIALLADGSVTAWGNDDSGQTDVPASATNIVAISAGGSHNLALRADGTVIGWGDDQFGQIDIPAGVTNLSLPVGISGTVDPTTPGTYELTYSATNALGVVATTTRTVIITPASPPLVEILPLADLTTVSATLNASVNPNGAATTMSFVWGLSANYGNSLPVTPAISGNDPVAVSAGISFPPGVIYHYTLIASNSAGVTRGPDQIIWTPVMALNGSATMTVPFRTPFVDPGVAVTGPPIAFAVGYGYSLAVKADGTVVGWGIDGSGQIDVPANATNIVAIAAGELGNSLALTADGSLVVWGDNSYGEFNLPISAGGAVAIAESSAGSVALTSAGAVVAWGLDATGEDEVPVSADRNMLAVASGAAHGLALSGNGGVIGWGYNSDGEATVPALATAGVTAIAAGSYHSLALKTDGSVVAWGSDAGGQLDVPATAQNVTAIAGGYGHSIGLLTNGSVIAWGDDSMGQTDVPAAATNGVIAIASGWFNNLAQKSDGSLIAWGDNTYGQTNIPAALNVLNLPVSVAGSVNTDQPGTYELVYTVTNALGGVATIARTVIVPVPLSAFVVTEPATGASTNGATLNGTVNPNGLDTTVSFLWGANLGYGNTNTLAGSFNGSSALPFTTNIPGLQPGVIYHFNLQASNAAGLTFGRDQLFWLPQIVVNGPLAVTNTLNLPFTQSRAGVTLPPLAVAAGQYHSLALKADGSVVAWGANDVGQSFVPEGLVNAVGIAAGYFNSLALTANGTVVAWGDNSLGESEVPANATNVVAIAAGAAHGLAVRADGSVVGWGYDGAGQTQVPAALSGVVAASAGLLHSLALKADGSLIGWGDDSYGQREIPDSATNVIAIASGEYHNLALKSDGSVVAWGSDFSGEIEVPAAATNVIAIAAGGTASLALRSDGSVIGWGDNSLGQLVIPPGATNLLSIAEGYSHSLAIRGDGSVIGWGDDAAGEIDVPSGMNQIDLPVTTSGPVDVTTPGTYTLTYTATNAFGSSSVTVTVTVPSDTPPVVTIEPATEITNGVATLNGAVIPNSAMASVSFLWGATANYGNSVALNSNLAGNITQPVNAAISGLQPGVIYHYTLVASNDAGTNRTPDAILWSPELSLNGAAVITNALNTPFTDPGVTAIAAPIAVAAGDAFSLALKADGSVIGWGDNTYGQTNIPGGATNGVVAVAAGQTFALALKTDGSVICWGDNSLGQTNIPGNAAGVTAIASGRAHSLALLANGTVVGWGSDSSHQIDIPANATNIVAIAAGYDYSLALTASGMVIGWGDDTSGQRDITTGGVTAIAAGQDHTLTLQGFGGNALTWGDSGSGIPFGSGGIAAIAAGQSYSLGLETNGVVFDSGTIAGQPLPTNAVSGVTSIAAGFNNALAIKNDGSVINWGNVAVAVPAAVNVINLPFTVGLDLNTSIPGTNILVYTVTNALGAVSTISRTVIIPPPVIPGPTITRPPQSWTAIIGTTATFTVLSSDAGPLTYQWFYDEVAIPNATNSTYRVSDIQPSNAGNYVVQVANSIGGVSTSDPAVLTVADSEPVILTQPVDRTNTSGTAAGFAANGIVGTPPFFYQWYFNGALLPGATLNTYYLPDVQSTNAGGYSVIVTNAFGSTTSRVAVLTVVDTAPVITQQPASQSILAGSSLGFAIAATGTETLGYQWYFNNVAIPGATGTSYHLINLQSPQAGDYTVVVSNSVGVTTSTVAVLSIDTRFVALSGNYYGLFYEAAGARLASSGFVSFTVKEWGGLTGQLIMGGGTNNVSGLLALNGSAQLTATPAHGPALTLNLQLDLSGTNGMTGRVTDGAWTSDLQADLTPYGTTNLTSLSGIYTMVLPSGDDGAAVPTGLAAWWRGDGDANDSFGMNDGAIDGGVSFVAGQVGAGFDFDGTSGWINLGTNSVLRQSSAVTYSFWVNIPAGGGGWALGAGSAAGGQGFGGILVNNNLLRYTWTPLAPDSDASLSAVASIPADQWTHVAVMVDYTNQTAEMYVNGQSVTVTLSGGPVTQWTPDGSSNANQVDSLGGRLDGTLKYFNGALDEVTVYPRTLSVSEVQAIYNGGLSLPGHGYGLVVLDSKGSVGYNGTLPDNTPITSQTAWISAKGNWPFYALMDNDEELALGWLTVSGGNEPGVAGNVSWIKLADANSPYSQQGFTNFAAVVGSKYLPPGAGVRILDTTNATVVLTGGDLTAPLTNSVMLTRAAKIILNGSSNPNHLSLGYSLSYGFLSGSFLDPVSGNTMTIAGAILSNENVGFGFFYGPNHVLGTMLLTPSASQQAPPASNAP